MALSAATVRAALAAVDALGNQIRPLDELAAGAADALRQAPPGLTVAGAASFLATMAQESAYFRTTVEYGSDRKWYDPYRGRTFEQVTHAANYRAFGHWCKARGIIQNSPEQFVDDPPWLGDYRWAWLGGVWYFEANNLWRYANAGNHYAVSQGVNRGVGAIGTAKAPLHWRERNAMFTAFRAAGDAILPSPGPAAPAAAAAVAAARPTRRPRGGPMYFQTAEPEDGLPKWDWPTVRIPFSFDPIGGWGGDMIVKVDHGGRGGWIHALIWWVRDDGWNPSRPLHHPVVHPVGASHGHAGSERFVGFGWESRPPKGADFLEVVTSAPDGVIVRDFYQH